MNNRQLDLIKKVYDLIGLDYIRAVLSFSDEYG